MAKLFDSMAKLKFKEDGDGKLTKEAVGMYSKDGEYVDFDEPCKCVGQVCTCNIDGTLTFTRSCVDSSRTVLEHHRSFTPSKCIKCTCRMKVLAGAIYSF